jgi:hypothetical protein
MLKIEIFYTYDIPPKKNKTLKCSLAIRQTICCSQQARMSALSSCSEH